MTDRIYFCWERSLLGQWNPVCYFGEPPRPEKTTDGDIPRRSSVEAVPPEMIGADGEPKFGELQRKFPIPGASKGASHE